MRNSVIACLVFLTSCSKNIYQVPVPVQNLLSKGIDEAKSSDPDKPFIHLYKDLHGYSAYVLQYGPEMKQLKRLVTHSGRSIIIQGKRYPLISTDDKELSALYLKRGEKPDFHGVWSFHHGPFVSWIGAEVTDSWLAPRWQPKPDSLQPKE